MAKKAKKKVKKTARKKVARARKPKKMPAQAKKAVKKVAKKRVSRPGAVAPKPAEPTLVLLEGMRAPDFRLKAYPEGEYSLSELRGRKVVLYFYPKDDTSGCTMEACSFRDSKMEWEGSGAIVVGVSTDNLSSHQAFAQKYNLNFPLLADTDASISKAYGVYKEKNLYGKNYWGIERTTFIIDPDGKIARIFPRVQVDGHSTEVLEALKRM